MNVIIVGVTGAFGKAVALECLHRPDGTLHANQIHALVRSISKARAAFPSNPQELSRIRFIEGDIQRPEDLDRCLMPEAVPSDGVAEAAKPHCLVLVHAVNYPYHQWSPNTVTALRHSIEFARRNQALLLFPANVYPLKPLPAQSTGSTSISEATAVMEPPTRKGQLRLEMETMLRESGVQVLMMRAGDYYGPSLRNPFMQSLFADPLHKGAPITVYGSMKDRFDWVYLPDLAKASVDLVLRLVGPQSPDPRVLAALPCVHFRGLQVSNEERVQALQDELKAMGVAKPTVRCLPWFLVYLVGLADPEAREFHEMRYLYQKNVSLDDTLLRSLLPDMRVTSLRDTIRQTLESLSGTLP